MYHGICEDNKDDWIESVRECISCGSSSEDVFCSRCSSIIHDYDLLRDYVNSIEVVNRGLLFLLREAKNVRVSMAFNLVSPSQWNKLIDCSTQIFNSSALSWYPKRIIGEIRQLSDSIIFVESMLNGDDDGDVNGN